MDSQTTITGHVLMLSLPGWGHLRPLTSFACRVVRERPDVTVTLLTVGDLTPRVEEEISKHFSCGQADSRAMANIRTINIGGKGFDLFGLIPLIFAEFPGFFAKLLNGEPLKCRATEKTFDALGRPNAVVLDFFLLDVLRAIRVAAGKSIPVFSWISVFASPVVYVMGPERLGGLGDVPSKARTQAEATGRKVEDIIVEMFHSSTGTVRNVPGLPPMYDYEWHTQEFSPEVPQSAVWASGYIFLKESDGVVCVSNAMYEPESLDAMRSWFGDTNHPVYAVGPLVPPGFGDTGLSDKAKQTDIERSENGREVLTFLDKIFKSHGDRSLIYVSFGSVWWPKRNEHVWLFVDALLEIGFPFMLSHAPPTAVVPPGYADKIKQSGIGLLTTWSPQQTILSHRATGWILTHCGQNTVTEALSQGIPIIAWPLDADQPFNAANLTLILDVAFEMLEVRTGFGLKPLYRGARPTGTIEAVAAESRDILQRARGPEGERKRRNAESLRDKLKDEWKEGGEALKNVRQFLRDTCSGGK